MPIRVTKGWNLYVDGKLNGKPAQLMIDTGAFTTLIHRPFVREMRLRTRDTPYTSGAVNLVAGQAYAVVVEYYDATGDGQVRVRWQTPGNTGFVKIPQDRLAPPP